MSLILSGTNGVSDIDGDASTPAIRGTDTNTGIFFPAADTIGFAEGGAEVARFDSSGNLGIGTNSPGYKLESAGTIAAKFANPDASGMLIEATTGTNAAAMRFANTGGSGYVGLDSSTGARISGAAYSLNVVHAGAYPVVFGTNNTERARIDSTGRMLIATTSISSGSNTAGLEIKAPNATNGQYAFAVINSAGSAYSIAFRNDGYFRCEPVYAQTSGSAANVFVDSSGYLLRSTSSIKYKKDVVDYDKGLTAVQSLRPVYYKSNRTNADGNEDSHQYAGFIAEEIDAAGLTEFVQYGEDNTPESLAYGNMVALLTKAIQELKAELDTTKARLAALENK